MSEQTIFNQAFIVESGLNGSFVIRQDFSEKGDLLKSDEFYAFSNINDMMAFLNDTAGRTVFKSGNGGTCKRK